MSEISEKCVSLDGDCEQPALPEWSYMYFVNKHTPLKSEPWQHNRGYTKILTLGMFGPSDTKCWENGSTVFLTVGCRVAPQRASLANKLEIINTTKNSLPLLMKTMLH